MPPTAPSPALPPPLLPPLPVPAPTTAPPELPALPELPGAPAEVAGAPPVVSPGVGDLLEPQAVTPRPRTTAKHSSAHAGLTNHDILSLSSTEWPSPWPAIE